MIAKKMRIIWKEKLINDVTTVIPMISFDEGINWVSLEKEVTELRTRMESDSISSIKQIDQNWNQLDISVPFSPETIPYIMEDSCEIVSTSDESLKLDAGTYYIAVAANTLELVGNDTVGSNTTKYDMNISNIYKFSIDDNSSQVVNIYVQYPDYINGILVYMGKDNEGVDNTGQQALELIYVSNICGKLKSEFNGLSNEIILKNSQYFPLKGIITIGNQVISYNDLEYDYSDPINPVTRITSFNRLTLGDQSQSFNENTLVKLTDFKFGSVYSFLPPKVYPIIVNKNNLELYLSFDNKSLSDLGKNKKTVTTFPNSAISIYSSSTPKISGNSIKMTGNYVIDTLTELNNTEGTIHFYAMIDKMPTKDICLFGNKDGMSFYISSLSMKPYIKVKNAYYTDYLDSRIESMELNVWTRFAITWKTDENEGVLNKSFSFFINGYLAATVANTENADSLNNNIYFGGINTDLSETFTDFYNGYIDDFRIYSVEKTTGDLSDIHKNLVDDQNKYSGLIQISKRMKTNDSIRFVPDNNGIINFTGISRFENGTPVIYKNGVKLENNLYTIVNTTSPSVHTITLNSIPAESDIVVAYSNEINDVLPGTLDYQVNLKNQFDNAEFNISSYTILESTIGQVESAFTFPAEMENIPNVFYILINTSGSTWTYITDYTYNSNAKKITFNTDYKEKLIKIYMSTQKEIISGYSKILLNDGVDLSNARIAYPITAKSCKFKFDLSSSSPFVSPEVKDLGIIISNFSIE